MTYGSNLISIVVNKSYYYYYNQFGYLVTNQVLCMEVPSILVLSLFMCNFKFYIQVLNDIS